MKYFKKNVDMPNIMPSVYNLIKNVSEMFDILRQFFTND